MSALQKRVLQSGLPPRLPMSGGRGVVNNARKKRDYSAIHWSKHFNNKRHVKLDNGDIFCVYEGGVKEKNDDSIHVNDPALPVLVLLHGGSLN